MLPSVSESPFSKRRWTVAFAAVAFLLPACAADDGDRSGTGGAPATGGTGAVAGVAQGGASGTGASGGSTPVAGTASGGASGSASGDGGTTSGGTGAGGSPAGAGGSSAGVSGGGGGGAGAAGGGSGNAGSGGGGTPPGPSGLPLPPGNGGMPRPSGTPGNLRVLAWAGFRGAASFTFDDTNSSQIANYAALNALGVPFTFYIQTGKSTATDPVWNQALADGHELGNHTRNHSSDDDGSDTDAATQFLESRFSITVYTMAAPNGSSVYTNIARTRFLINRGVANAVIAPNDSSDPFTLPCYIPATGASASTMSAQIDSARSAGGWRVLLVHGFTGGSDGAYQPVALSEFTATVEHAKSLGDVWIDTVLEVGAYWRAQKALSSVAPVSSGGDQVYSWTLPDHFPPGRFLRVTVDGGTLRQGGAELPWNDRGFYEVALDVGSVTLSP